MLFLIIVGLRKIFQGGDFGHKSGKTRLLNVVFTRRLVETDREGIIMEVNRPKYCSRLSA